MTDKVAKESFDEWAAKVGLEKVPEGAEPSVDDWIVASHWTISGPAAECLANPYRYRPVAGGLADPATLGEKIRTTRIVFENAPDGGVAVYQETVSDGTREWLCGYGREDAEWLFILTTISMLVNHAHLDGVSLEGGPRRRSIRFWSYARKRYNELARRVRAEWEE